MKKQKQIAAGEVKMNRVFGTYFKENKHKNLRSS